MTNTIAPQRAWMPYPNTMTHAGSPISESPQDIEFFAAPPPDIGNILSVSTTLNRKKHPFPAALKIIFSVLTLLVFLVLGLLMWQGSPTLFCVMLAIGGGLAFLLYTALSFNHQCSFVGEQGVALYRLSGSRSAPIKEEKLLFRDAANLYVQQTRHYYNGVYTGTEYNYQFQKPQDKPHRISGRYKDNKKWSPANDLWFFAKAAEDSWTSYLLEFVNQQLQQYGYIEFAIGGNPRAVRVGDGYLEFVSKDETTAAVAVADMKKISLNNGFFYFEHKDSTWWQGKGKYSFAYGGLPNANAFLICLDKLAGIRWS
jgi:hypothetical protein